jgi:hypothetical protein
MKSRLLAGLGFALAALACGSSPGPIVRKYPGGATSGTEILAFSPPGKPCASGGPCHVYAYRLGGPGCSMPCTPGDAACASRCDIETQLASTSHVDLDVEALLYAVEPEALGLTPGEQTIIDGPYALPDPAQLCDLHVRSGRADDWACRSSVTQRLVTFSIKPKTCFDITRFMLDVGQPDVPFDIRGSFQSGDRGRVAISGDLVFVSECVRTSSVCDAKMKSHIFTIHLNSGTLPGSLPVTGTTAMEALVRVDGSRGVVASTADGLTAYDEALLVTGSVRLPARARELRSAMYVDGMNVLSPAEAFVGLSANHLFRRKPFPPLPADWDVLVDAGARGLGVFPLDGAMSIGAVTDRSLLLARLDGSSPPTSIALHTSTPYALGPLVGVLGTRTLLAAVISGPGVVTSLAVEPGATTVESTPPLEVHDAAFDRLIPAAASTLERWPNSMAKYVVVGYSTLDSAHDAYVGMIDASTLTFVAPPQYIGQGPVDQLAAPLYDTEMWTYLPWSSEAVRLSLGDPSCIP